MKHLHDLSLDFAPLGENPELGVSSLGLMPLLKQVLQQSEGYITEASERGYLKPDAEDPNNQRFLNKVEELGGRLLHKTLGEDDGFDHLYLWDHGIVNVITGDAGYFQLFAASLNGKWVEDLAAYVKSHSMPAAPKGYIFAIVRSGNAMHLSQIGNAAIPLETGNYIASVITDYKFVVRDLASRSPSGRIVILEGEPGGGKTHLIRGLLHEVHNSMFVLVSPDMVPSLAGPDLLPLLINTKSSYRITGPIILILEDADQCLVKREGDNMSFIQSLLNLGDGILGSMLDLRIIATTNAKKLEMESAILRPGRLSCRLEVSALDLDVARQVFNRLLPNVSFPEMEKKDASVGFRSGSPSINKMTLAEVYALARKHGWEPTARTEDYTSVADYGYDDDDK